MFKMNTYLRKLGEDTIYSAKGHFKASDQRREMTKFVIWSCAVLNTIGISILSWPIPYLSPAISVLSFLGSVMLLVWNEGDGKTYAEDHMKVGEQYLSLHKRLREYYYRQNFTEQDLDAISEEIRNLDMSPKPIIPRRARLAAKKAIEFNDPETDNWFKTT